MCECHCIIDDNSEQTIDARNFLRTNVIPVLTVLVIFSECMKSVLLKFTHTD